MTLEPLIGSTALSGRCLSEYRAYSKVRIRTALGSYGRAMPKSIGPPEGQCVSFSSSHPCTSSEPSPPQSRVTVSRELFHTSNSED